MSGGRLALVVVVFAFASVVQGVSGFGFALVSMPLMSAVLGVPDALAIQTTLGIFSNAATAIHARADVLRDTTARILLASFCGMPFGWLMLEHVNGRWLKLLVGVVVGTVALLFAFDVRPRAVGRGADVVSGFVSGVLATSTGTNGPPMVIGLAGRRLAAAAQRATLATCFAVANVVVFVILLVDGRIDGVVVRGVVASLPVVLLAWALGERIFGRLDQHRYDRVVVVLLLASAGVAIVSSLVR